MIKKLIVLFLLFAFITACSYSKDTTNENKPSETQKQLQLSSDASDTSPSATPEENSEGKITLTIGAFSKENTYKILSYNWLKEAVRDFNIENEKYNIEIIDYGNRSDPDSMSRLNADITAGKKLDMLSTYGMPDNKYAKLGLFVDMSGWFDTDEFFSNPYESMKYNEKLYWISPSFSILTFYGLKSVLGDKDSYTLNDIYNDWNNFHNGENVFTYQLGGYKTLLMISTILENQFINYDTATCSFDSDRFIKLLEFCKKIPAETKITQTEKKVDGGGFELLSSECVANKDALLGIMTTAWQTGSVLGMHNFLITPLKRQELVYIGVPGILPASAVCAIQMPLAVIDSSVNKEGAKEFINNLWGLKFMNKFDGELRSVPLNRSALDEHIKELHKWSRTFTDENGNEYSGIVLDTNLVPYTDEDINDFISIVESARIPLYNQNIDDLLDGTYTNSIIQEEATAFFAGTQTAEQTAKYIQSRYSIYLEEQK